MVVTDPIADFLIRIKNGYLAKKKVVTVPWSKMKEKISEILVKEGYLKKYQISKIKDQKGEGNILELELKYEGKKPVLTEVKRISKPGVRIYVKAGKIPQVKEGMGITIVSTPQGLMTEKEARKNHQGGEVICQIW